MPSYQRNTGAAVSPPADPSSENRPQNLHVFLHLPHQSYSDIPFFQPRFQHRIIFFQQCICSVIVQIKTRTYFTSSHPNRNIRTSQMIQIQMQKAVRSFSPCASAFLLVYTNSSPLACCPDILSGICAYVYIWFTWFINSTLLWISPAICEKAVCSCPAFLSADSIFPSDCSDVHTVCPHNRPL